MSRHTGRSAARGATVSCLRTGARPSVLGLLLAGLLLAAACGHKTSAAQALRTCVDRWNQGNMVGWGPAPVNVSFRRPVAKERASIQLSARRQCIVSIAALDVRADRLGRLLVSAAPRAHGPAPDEQERDERQARRPRTRLAA